MSGKVREFIIPGKLEKKLRIRCPKFGRQPTLIEVQVKRKGKQVFETNCDYLVWLTFFGEILGTF